MIQEAVLKTVEDAGFVGFFIEEEEWQALCTLESEQDVKVSSTFKWRVTDLDSGETQEGKIPFSKQKDAERAFNQTWNLFINGHLLAPEITKPKPTTAPIASEYADHPQFGLF